LRWTLIRIRPIVKVLKELKKTGRDLMEKELENSLV